MFLATTALEETWNKQDEILFLGTWCLRHSRRRSWETLRHRVLPSPWNDAQASRDALAEAGAASENLLRRLSEHLNRVHGTTKSLRYWRLVLGPWLLGYVSSFADRDLHLRAALKDSPGLRTRVLDPRDYAVPRDTAQAALWRWSDRFNFQLYSQALAHRRVSGEILRLPPAELEAAPTASWKSAAYDALFRIASAVPGRDSRAYFSDLYLDRPQILRLMAAAKFRFAPVLNQLPPGFRFAPLDSPARRGLAGLSKSGGLEGLLASALPSQLPTIFLEGYPAARGRVLADWPRTPRLLVTSVGYFYNEYFKLLAAESVDRGGRLVIAQHGGGFGMQATRDNERHERAVADVYATWGWKDDFAPGAELRPLPNPRLTPPAARRNGPSPAKWLMICGTLARYPYSGYFAEQGASSRFGESLDWRLRFLEALPPENRDRLSVRLHHDHGWDQRLRLTERFPGLAFDEGGPWVKRRGEFGLVVIDHPQTSMLEALALDVPSLLFWDPELWPLRPSARPLFDVLRRAGILFDSPRSAAAQAQAVAAAPALWWRGESVQAARAEFCRTFAYGRSDWASVWTRQLGLDGAPPRPPQ